MVNTHSTNLGPLILDHGLLPKTWRQSVEIWQASLGTIGNQLDR